MSPAPAHQHASAPEMARRSGLSVLHVVLSLNPGGAERTVISIIKQLVTRAPMAVCCLEEEGAWAPELQGLGISVTALNRGAGFRPSLGGAIAEIGRRHQATVLHCHQYTPFVYGLIASLRLRTRLIFTEQGRLSDGAPSRKRQLVNPILGRLPHHIFAVSSDLRRHMIAEGFPARRIGVIHNAITPGLPPRPDSRAAARRVLGLPDDAFVIGSAARLDPVKDLETLIRAIALMRTTVPKAQLVLIGDGPERGLLEKAVSRAGIGAAVLFTGYRSDVRHILPALDVYVNCSISEAISLTILEAMASALPVVATRVGGNPEVVAENETGLLVPARSPDSLAHALVTLANEPHLAQTFGARGRGRLETSFSVEAMADRYLLAYTGELTADNSQ